MIEMRETKPVRPSRRQVLAGVGTAATFGVAGCTSDDPSTVQLASIALTNADTETAHTFTVRISDGNTDVAEIERTLDRATREESGDDTYISSTSAWIDCTWGADPKPFVVQAETAESQTAIEVAERANDDDLECVGLSFVRSPTGGLAFTMSECDG